MAKLPGRYLPNSNRLVIAATGREGPLRIEAEGVDRTGMAAQEMPELAAADIPEPDRRVITPAQQIAVVYMTMLAVIRGPCSSSLT
jgi:hypothetical protein